MANFTIITKQGELITLEQWQTVYSLEVGSNHLGNHFSIGEPSINDGGTISELVIRVLDAYRELKGKPVTINSFDRTEEKQQELTNEGYRTATVSPHVAKMAADIDTISKGDTNESLQLLIQAASDEGIIIRIGYKQYMLDGNTFIHFDVCPMYFASGKPYNYKPHPKPWEVAYTW